MLAWFETTALALTVRDSLVLTALLSGVHLVGMTISVGAVLVMTLRLTGRAFAETPLHAAVVPASRGLAAGVMLSLTSGLLLVLPRASTAVENSFFQNKMLALALAVAFQVVLFRRLSRSSGIVRGATGVAATLLWGAVAVLGCLFTLVE